MRAPHSGPPSSRLHAPERVWSVTGLAAAASILLAVNLFVTSRLASNGVELSLVAAVGTTRTFDARLSGGFMYARCVVPFARDRAARRRCPRPADCPGPH